ncbi:MAG: SRPBCC domain-containing protein [Parvibaculaceae bacterium]
MAQSLVVRREVEIAAPAATVFAFLTDPDKILRWIGTETTADPRPGGIYLVNVGGKHRARGEFTEVVPVHRLAYSFGWEGGEKVPPGSSLVEIDLIDRPGGTLVRFTHSGLPDQEECDGHDKGWAHYLNRLVVAATGGDPGPDRDFEG